MELKAFPPADDMFSYLQEIDYKNLWQQFVMITATIIAIAVGVFAFVYRNVNNWYNNGGREQLIRGYNFVIVNVADLIDDIKDRMTI